jgi:hypothetical protein
MHLEMLKGRGKLFVGHGCSFVGREIELAADAITVLAQPSMDIIAASWVIINRTPMEKTAASVIYCCTLGEWIAELVIEKKSVISCDDVQCEPAASYP